MAKTPEEVAAQLQRKHASVARHLAEQIAAHDRTKFELKKLTELLGWIHRTDQPIENIKETIEKTIPNYLKQKGQL